MLCSVFYVTVLSNFPRAYDKYGACYDKAHIPESTFSDRFYVLDRAELHIGVTKASSLLKRLALPGDRLIAIEACVPEEDLHPNTRTGLGRYRLGSALPVSRVHYFADSGELVGTSVEEAMAAALALRLPEMQAYASLRPRSVSVLPVALACQAACRFCFSKTSVSSDIDPAVPPVAVVRRWVEEGARRGAERLVITGGGEPGLAKHAYLLDLIALGKSVFNKSILITNGVHLARREPGVRAEMLRDYGHAGLSVLSISRHHHDDVRNAAIMGLDTRTGEVLASYREIPPAERPRTARLICVLQKGGIDSRDALRAFIDWAVAQGVTQICFKELYVSTTLESAYHANPENSWAREHQVSLSLVTEFMEDARFQVTSLLPWGAPVYEGEWAGKPLAVAAYTEPSLYWERTHGVARSWNIMADGQCLVSLEDLQSGLEGSAHPIIPIKAV